MFLNVHHKVLEAFLVLTKDICFFFVYLLVSILIKQISAECMLNNLRLGS